MHFTVEKIVPEQTGNLPNVHNKSGTATREIAQSSQKIRVSSIHGSSGTRSIFAEEAFTTL
jgi:hypothetical protein